MTENAVSMTNGPHPQRLSMEVNGSTVKITMETLNCNLIISVVP